jgi:hypothetical protein
VTHPASILSDCPVYCAITASFWVGAVKCQPKILQLRESKGSALTRLPRGSIIFLQVYVRGIHAWACDRRSCMFLPGGCSQPETESCPHTTPVSL